MRIEIEIPKEFEEHFKQDKFEDTLHRLSADAHLIAGNYEKETAIMLIKAFKESKPAYDLDAVEERLEKLRKKLFEEAEEGNYVFGVIDAIDGVIDIVRNAGKDGAK